MRKNLRSIRLVVEQHSGKGHAASHAPVVDVLPVLLDALLPCFHVQNVSRDRELQRSEELTWSKRLQDAKRKAKGSRVSD